MKKIIVVLLMLILTGSVAISQKIGIGTTTPIARLEVKGESTTGTTNALALKNSNGDTLLRMRNDGRLNIGYNGTTSGRTVNIGGGANFYLNDTLFNGGIFPSDTSLTIWSDFGDNRYLLLQPDWGKVGIGTEVPGATLDVHGTVIIGDSGSVLTRVIKRIIIKDPAPIPANSATTEIFPVIGANPGSAVSISPAVELPDGLLISYARVASPGAVEVKFMNVTNASINPFFTVFIITVIQ